eukprot:gene47356-biopygen13482
MQSLFSPFKQAQRLAGGTGLGLFSLSRRVDAIGGRYGVMKRPDGKQGSVFWFEIPYKPDTLPFMANPPQKGLKILLVDDTLSIQKMTSMLLKKQGHTVTIAENGVEALERITSDYLDRELTEK